MSNIVLIGFMGSGKTTIGRNLGRKLSMPLLDTDKLIVEQQGITINEIFATKGEPFFRQLETKIVEELIEKEENAVISTGGGLVITEGNGELLKKLGKVVFLRTKEETIVKRLAGDDTRPLLKGGLDEKTHKLLEYRTPIYEKYADIIIDTDNNGPAGLAEQIIERMTAYEDFSC